MTPVSSNSSIFISIKSCLQFLTESDPRPNINIVFPTKRNPSPKTPILSSKTLEKFSKTCGPELGHFQPLASRRVLGRGRCHRPPTLHTHRPGRCATSGRSRQPNFTANRHRTRPDRVGEAAAAATMGHRAFLDFPAISGHFRPTQTSFPPFMDPLNSFPWSLFADSSPFERYDKNKVG